MICKVRWYALFLCFSSIYCCADGSGCSSAVTTTSSKPQEISDVLTTLAKDLQLSILAEVHATKPVNLPDGAMLLRDVLHQFDPSLRCEEVGKTLHIYEPSVLNIPGNSLNYIFSYFAMPADVDHLRLMLQARLRDEPFNGDDKHKVLMKEGSGYVATDGARYPLQKEVFKNKTGRELLLRAGSEQVFVTLLQFPPELPRVTPKQIWEYASRHWIWSLQATDEQHK